MPMDERERPIRRSYKRIKNYTTSVSVGRTIREIKKMLHAHGIKIKQDMTKYDDEQNPVALYMLLENEFGEELPVKLPVFVEGVKKTFKQQVSEGKLGNKYWGDEWAEEQAHRVAWRILKDWLDAQLAIYNAQMVKLQEIMLPYAYDMNNDRTFYDMIEKKGLENVLSATEDLPALEEGKEKGSDSDE